MKVETGYEGDTYLVFNSEEEADDYRLWLEEQVDMYFRFACFGGFYNALELTKENKDEQ